MISMFSLNTSIIFFLPGFTLNQQGFLSYLRRYCEEDAGALEEPAAAIDGADAKAQNTEDLRRLKKVYNRIALAAKLSTPWLRHEMMDVTCNVMRSVKDKSICLKKFALIGIHLTCARSKERPEKARLVAHTRYRRTT